MPVDRRSSVYIATHMVQGKVTLSTMHHHVCKHCDRGLRHMNMICTVSKKLPTSHIPVASCMRVKPPNEGASKYDE